MFEAWRARKTQQESEARLQEVLKRTLQERRRKILELHPLYIDRVIARLPERIEQAAVQRKGWARVYDRDEFFDTCSDSDLKSFSSEYREKFLPLMDWKKHPGVNLLRDYAKKAGYEVDVVRVPDDSYSDYAGAWNNWYIKFSW